jgi:arsenite methyltransferase
MHRVPTEPSRLSSLGSITSLLAVATCYGTLAAIALLSVIGVSIEVNEGALVTVITGLLILALAGMMYSYRGHGTPGPLVLSIAAAALLIWVFYGAYSKPLELTGFAGLVVASVWDFRAKKAACPASNCTPDESR